MTLSNLVPIILQVVAPVMLIAGAGFLFGWRTKAPVQPISRLAFYILAPSLVFKTLSGLEWQSTGTQHMLVFTVLSTLGLGALAWLVARMLRLQPPLSNAFVLVVMFTNGGNYGLPLNLFAFGQPGMDIALVYFVTSGLLINSVGVFVASSGRAGVGKALLNMLGAPLLWAGLAGFLVNLFGVTLPETITRAVDVAGQGAVPIMLLVLGMQLGRISLDENPVAIGAATLLKLALAPLLAWGVTILLSMHGLARQVGIIEASMPTAVMTTIIATQYDTAPGFTASVVFVSTLLSLVSLTLLLAWLM